MSLKDEGIPTQDVESQKANIAHFVGHLLLMSRLKTADGESAQETKKHYLENLKSHSSGSLVDEVVVMIERANWDTKEGIEEFATLFDEFIKKN